MSDRLLFDGNRGSESRNAIHRGLGHLANKLPSVRRKALDVAALPFGINRIHRQRAFATTAWAREDRHRPMRNIERNISQIVLRCTFDVQCGRQSSRFRSWPFLARSCGLARQHARQRKMARKRPRTPTKLPARSRLARPNKAQAFEHTPSRANRSGKQLAHRFPFAIFGCVERALFNVECGRWVNAHRRVDCRV